MRYRVAIRALSMDVRKYLGIDETHEQFLRGLPAALRESLKLTHVDRTVLCHEVYRAVCVLSETPRGYDSTNGMTT